LIEEEIDDKRDLFPGLGALSKSAPIFEIKYHSMFKYKTNDLFFLLRCG